MAADPRTELADSLEAMCHDLVAPWFAAVLRPAGRAHWSASRRRSAHSMVTRHPPRPRPGGNPNGAAS